MSLRIKDIFRSVSPADGGRLFGRAEDAVGASVPLLATRGNDGTLLRRTVG